MVGSREASLEVNQSAGWSGRRLSGQTSKNDGFFILEGLS
jgi:hypothetical protein